MNLLHSRWFRCTRYLGGIARPAPGTGRRVHARCSRSHAAGLCLLRGAVKRAAGDRWPGRERLQFRTRGEAVRLPEELFVRIELKPGELDVALGEVRADKADACGRVRSVRIQPKLSGDHNAALRPLMHAQTR